MSSISTTKLTRPRWNQFEISFHLPPALRGYRWRVVVTDLENRDIYDYPPQRTSIHETLYECKKFRGNLPNPHLNKSYTVRIDVEGVAQARVQYPNLRRIRLHIEEEYTMGEMNDLLQKATTFYSQQIHSQDAMQQCHVFYRDKTWDYFDNINQFEDNVMAKYAKDKNGDPFSPINQHGMQGLFFGVNVDKNSKLPTTPYGRRRLEVPCNYFMDRQPNLYFADFYCTKVVHFVTLVVTPNGSWSDRACKRKLQKLDWKQNPFLVYRTGQMYVAGHGSGKFKCWIEVFYTEDVDLDEVLDEYWGRMSTNWCPNESRHGGRPKRTDCTICNVWTLGQN